MPKVTSNPLLLESVSGAIGDLVFYRDPDGHFIVRHKGKRTAPASLKQQAHHQQFRLAAAYGKHAAQDPALAAEYRPFCRGRMTVYHVALRDFLTPPKVSVIDLQAFTGQPGEMIRIVASDDTQVVSVEVVIRDASNNTVLEQGLARPSVIPDEWLYLTTTAIPGGTHVQVDDTTTDTPGHTGTARVPFSVL